MAAIIFACLLTHPLFAAVSLLCALILSVRLRGRKAVRLSVILLLLTALWTLWYASFHHFGVTVLKTNAIGNAITLEAIVCGFMSGIRIAIVIILISCFLTVFTTDKIVYLTGRVSPRLSLYLAIAFRWLPESRRTAVGISQAQAGIGIRQGPRCRVLTISAAITQMFDRFSVLAGSMRARGYGLPGRTSYSVYRFESRDRICVIVLFALIAVTAVGYACGAMSALYNPQIILAPFSPALLLCGTAYALLLLAPLIMERISSSM